MVDWLLAEEAACVLGGEPTRRDELYTAGSLTKGANCAAKELRTNDAWQHELLVRDRQQT